MRAAKFGGFRGGGMAFRGGNWGGARFAAANWGGGRWAGGRWAGGTPLGCLGWRTTLVRCALGRLEWQSVEPVGMATQLAIIRRRCLRVPLLRSTVAGLLGRFSIGAIPITAMPPLTDDDGCYAWRRVGTPWGLSWRQVWVCN